MIPEEVETRIAHYYFQRYLPEPIALDLSSLLVPYYMDDEEQPSADQMVHLSIEFLEQALEEYE